MSTTTNTKRSAKAAAAEAALLALPEQTPEAAMRAAIISASTSAQYLAAADKAAAFVADTEASAWQQTLSGRRSIGEALYLAYSAKAAEADANVERKAAADITFTTLMAALYGVDKSGYEAADKAARKGPGKRGWSTLSEDVRAVRQHVWRRLARCLPAVTGR